MKQTVQQIAASVKLKLKGNTDSKQVASKEDYEVNYISFWYKIPKQVIPEVIKMIGTSRKRVYAVLREMGYTIDTTKRKK